MYKPTCEHSYTWDKSIHNRIQYHRKGTEYCSRINKPISIISYITN